MGMGKNSTSLESFQRPSSTTKGQSVHLYHQDQLPTITRQFVPVLWCIAGMQIIYSALHFAYDSGLMSNIGFPQPAEEYCRGEINNGKCGRADLFAFQAVGGVVFLTIASLSIYAWYFGPAIPNSLPESRLFGYSEYAFYIIVVNLAYQVWDFMISLTIPEHCTPIMMTHHAVAAFIGWSTMYNQMFGFYPIFFAGLSEVSSVFLVALDFAKFFEPQPGTWFDLFVGAFAAPLFLVTFAYYRVIKWLPTSKQMFDDVQTVVRSGRAEQLRPGRTWILYMWLTMVIPMSLLQLYWMGLVLDKARSEILGS